ncbi:MAG: 3-hydroxyacyl-ACP dehydratase FabZ [Acidobacteria bacterium]|nr:3-hydroxyacyl-ACP dehydratase FabZ [Acidobacteriota bacterium]
MIFDAEAIQKILPHRAPFLLVDAVLELEPRKRVVAVKKVRPDEPFFAGHFPGHPVMPGVLIIEAIAQAGGFMLMKEVKDRDAKLMYFAGVEEARFRRPVLPGDELRLEVEMVYWRNNVCKMAGKALVGDQVAAEATVMCKLVERGGQPASAGKPR